jgi:hypothetical protein
MRAPAGADRCSVPDTAVLTPYMPYLNLSIQQASLAYFGYVSHLLLPIRSQVPMSSRISLSEEPLGLPASEGLG